MTLSPRLAVVLATGALLTAATPGIAPANGEPIATAAKTCGVGNAQGYGTTYVMWIRARNVSCRKARERVRAFHKCRQGAKGRCPNLGAWRCSENRGPRISTQFYSTATCKRGGKVVKHRYQQNT